MGGMKVGTKWERRRESICHQGAVWTVGTAGRVSRGLLRIPSVMHLADEGSLRRFRCCGQLVKEQLRLCVTYLMRAGRKEWICWKNVGLGRLHRIPAEYSAAEITPQVSGTVEEAALDQDVRPLPHYTCLFLMFWTVFVSRNNNPVNTLTPST